MGVPIRMMDELRSFVANNEVDIAALTIPKDKAVEVADMLVENGVRAIWNFAHIDLNLPDQCDCRECSSLGESYAVVI